MSHGSGSWLVHLYILAEEDRWIIGSAQDHWIIVSEKDRWISRGSLDQQRIIGSDEDLWIIKKSQEKEKPFKELAEEARKGELKDQKTIIKEIEEPKNQQEPPKKE